MKYLKWLSKAIRPYWAPVTVMMVCHVLIASCSIGFVYVSKKLVDVAVAIFGGEPAGLGIWPWAGAMIAITVLRILFNALRSYLQTKTEIRLKNGLRHRLFDILLHLQTDGGARHHSGDVLNRMQEDVRVVSNAVAVSVPNLFGTLLQFVAALVFLLILDLRLALVVVAVVPVGVAAGKFITSRIRSLTLDIRKSDSRVQAHVQESIQHITLIQSLEHTGASASELLGLQNILYGNELKRTRFSIVSRIFISLAFSAGHAIAFIWGVSGISTGTVTYGMMTAFLQLVGQIQRPIVEMSSQIPSIIHATASIDRLLELEALPREDVSEQILIEGTAGVRLSDICFAYPDSERDVLHHFSHDFKPGSRTAIVGPTGVGKSTLIRLLLTLLRPRSGSIDIYAGHDAISGMDSAGKSIPLTPALRCNMAYVPQGNTLFSGTIRENLLMGDPEASQERLEWALHTSAADFVSDLPDGMDTQCFEAGGGLSEGQAQRIAIARTLLRPGTILLLDEFSSALDAETEKALMERLTAALPDHTMIFITHRERIIDYCDSVLRF
ncbi:MAG: ABC transporter ATP-binding protein [Bacteroidales bacterium]|nr:ABC transporter ATP-binding protein [Bacteroidales bacterium]